MAKSLYRMLLLILCCSLVFSSAAYTVSAEAASDTSKIRDIYMPETKIVNPPVVVQNVNNAEKLSKLQDAVRPQAAWLTLTSNCQVKLGDDCVSLSDALTACDGKVLPILEIPDMECAEVVSGAIKDQYFDLLLASPDPAVLKKLHQDKIGYTRLVYLADQAEPAEIVNTALTNGAMIVAMKNPTREVCEYLQKRFLTVLVNPALENDEENVRFSVDCGANFVVLDGFQTAYDMYASVTEEAFVRRAYVVGHRGMVTYAPDNTYEGVQDAFDNGADAAEIDIRYTADKQIVCFHNNDLSGATIQQLDNPTKRIEEYTLEELKQFTLRFATGHIYKNAKIPTLQEILNVVKQYPDKILVIEFKDFLVDPQHLNSVLEEYDVIDQCVFIGFGKEVLDRHYPVIPMIGASLLDAGYPQDNASGCVDRYYSVSIGSVASYSPSYAIPDDAVEMLHCRGITLNLWTANTFSMMEGMAKRGAQFITTDRVEDHNVVHDLYLNMGADPLFAKYKPTSEPPAPTPDTNTENSTSTTDPSDAWKLLPWFFVLPGIAFVAAIFIKIYNVRKKQ